MTEEIVKYETATLAKESGFILSHPLYLYDENGEIVDTKRSFDLASRTFILDSKTIIAPTQSLLQRWLREIHNIDVDVTRDSEVHYQDETRWIVRVSNWNDIRIKDFPIAQLKFPNHSHHTDFKSYEEALEKGLVEGLKFIDNEKI
jgi:hypothetical protein